MLLPRLLFPVLFLLSVPRELVVGEVEVPRVFADVPRLLVVLVAELRVVDVEEVRDVVL